MSKDRSGKPNPPDLVDLMTSKDGLVLPHEESAGTSQAGSASAMAVAATGTDPAAEESAVSPGAAHIGEVPDHLEFAVTQQRARREKRRRQRLEQESKPNRKNTSLPIRAGPVQYLSVRDLATRFRVGVATIWRWSSGDGGFPKPVRLSKGTTRWVLSDVVAFEARQRGTK